MRSTIIASSAASFSLSMSSPLQTVCGLVPLIGRVTTEPSRRTRKKSSGLIEITAPPHGSSINAPNHARFSVMAACANARALPVSDASKRRAMLA